MEIRNELVMCPKGHYYNAAVHQACPICGGVAAAVAAKGGSFTPTEPLPGPGAPGGYAPPAAPVPPAPPASPVGPTAPATSWSTLAGPADPFGVKTTIGGDLAAGGQTEPVAGWLVCVAGPARGSDWRIHAGYNYIGREAGDICIRGDNQISREKHAMVAYYDKTKAFYVGPSEGRNIIELNGSPVFNAVALKNRDIISIGATRLMFVPLCGEEFNWEQEKEHE